MLKGNSIQALHQMDQVQHGMFIEFRNTTKSLSNIRKIFFMSTGSPCQYANFITENFITTIFQNSPEIFGLCVFTLGLAKNGQKIAVMKE